MNEKTKVLIVDDDPDCRFILRASLECGGFEIHEAEDGPEAIERCNDLEPDLLLLDVRMPGMSGHEVATRLHGNDATHDIPIIMLTGMDDRCDVEEARRNRVSDYALKTADRGLLMEKIRLALEQ